MVKLGWNHSAHAPQLHTKTLQKATYLSKYACTVYVHIIPGCNVNRFANCSPPVLGTTNEGHTPMYLENASVVMVRCTYCFDFIRYAKSRLACVSSLCSFVRNGRFKFSAQSTGIGSHPWSTRSVSHIYSLMKDGYIHRVPLSAPRSS